MELHKLKEENIQLTHDKKTQAAEVKRLEEECADKVSLQKKLELADLEIKKLTKENEFFERTCDEQKESILHLESQVTQLQIEAQH